MSFSFNSIPINIRTPGSFVEFDNSRAIRGLPAAPQKIMVIGQLLGTGTATPGTAVRVSTPAIAVALFGRGSMLARMFAAMKKVDATVETWAVPLSDLGGGAKATGSLVFSGTPTVAGTLALYIAGVVVPVGIAASMASTAVATAVAAAINANPDLPLVATVGSSTVTLTAQHKGLCGNDIDVRTNYYQSDALPAGMAVAITGLSGGTGNPDVTGVFTAIGDKWFPTFIMPYTDAANLTVVEAELLSRWGPLRQIDALAYTAAKGTQGTLSTLGDTRNSPFPSMIGANNSPTSPCEWAAAYGAACAFQGQIDPGRQMRTVPLPGIMPPPEANRFTRTERDQLLNDGISTFTVDPGGVVVLDRAITMSRVNLQGLPDASYLDVTTILTASYLRYSLRQRMDTKFPRHKLADDGNVYPAGQAVVTPKILKAETVSLFHDWQDAALVENVDQFIADLVIERDLTDRNRVNAIIPPDLINQFNVFAAQIQFIL